MSFVQSPYRKHQVISYVFIFNLYDVIFTVDAYVHLSSSYLIRHTIETVISCPLYWQLTYSWICACVALSMLVVDKYGKSSWLINRGIFASTMTPKFACHYRWGRYFIYRFCELLHRHTILYYTRNETLIGSRCQFILERSIDEYWISEYNCRMEVTRGIKHSMLRAADEFL